MNNGDNHNGNGSLNPFGTHAPFDAGAADGVRFNSQETLFTDPRQVLRKAAHIIRSRWLVAIAAAAIVGGGFAAALFRLRPVEFTAVSTLLAQSSLDQILNPEGDTPEEFGHQENVLTNHLSVMTSNMFRQRVARSFTPAESLEIQAPYLRDGRHPSEANLEAVLAKRVSVEREREKDFFTVSAKHADAGVALMVANRFTADYLDLVQSELHKANEAAAGLLSKQAAALRKRIADIEDERRAYRKEHKLISAEENQTILEDRIKEVNLARADLRVQEAKLRAEVAQAGADLAGSPLPFGNSVLSAYAGIEPLRQQLDSLGLQKSVLSMRYGPNNEKMVEVQGGIDATKASLERDYQLAYADLKSQLGLALESEKGLNADFDEAFSESLELSRVSGRLNSLGQEADGERKTLDDLYQRIGKASVDTGLPADVLRVIDPGFIKRPLVPLQALYAFIIGLAALGAFCFAPIAVNFFDERINENVDLEGTLHLGVVGVVPRFSGIRREDRPHIVRHNADLAVAEAFITLASQIELAAPRDGGRRILVTSALPSEGKSTVAANLAAAYTRLGRKTVLVDCDFRKPSQRAMHGVGGDSGLLPWAKAGFQEAPGLLGPGGQVSAAALADGTFLIPAGASDLQPARYLVADGMARFFALLQREFEVVVVDTPPAGVFQDALIAARHCDETVLVARDGKASTGQLTRILHDFARTHAPVIGLVLNGFTPTSGHPQLGRHKLYRKYGHYGRPARAEAAKRGA